MGSACHAAARSEADRIHRRERQDAWAKAPPSRLSRANETGQSSAGRHDSSTRSQTERATKKRVPLLTEMHPVTPSRTACVTWDRLKKPCHQYFSSRDRFFK